MWKKLLTIGVLVFLLIGVFFALNNYIYEQKQEGGSEEFSPYRGTLEGEYVCLPHKDSDGPQTMECAFGIKTDAGEYYAVDFGLVSQEIPELQVGDRFSANGTITPVENLSSDFWQKYDIEGIFSVTDSVQIIGG